MTMHEGDLARCREVIRASSKSFDAASRVLPSRVRVPAVALYAFCRAMDDAVDESDDPRAGLERSQRRLDRAYRGVGLDGAIDRAFAWVVGTFAIPRVVPEALLEGMEWDAVGRRYETEGDLVAYAARVAGTVGVMMALVMGRREPHVIARACDLGVAMQITNVCRDVGEDAARGRIYLPDAWLREAGVDRGALLVADAPPEGLAIVVRRALDLADELYVRADAGIARLPRDCRVAIRAARLLYADIGRSIARARFDSITRRAVVSGPRKMWLLARSLFPTRASRRLEHAPPLAETAFLIDAAARGA